MDQRLKLLASVLIDASDVSLLEAVDLVAEEVRAAPNLLWLTYAVCAARLPTDEDMDLLLSRARLGGTWSALAPWLTKLASANRFRTVRLLRRAVTCDVDSTANSDYLSGIQRVVRETTSRWHRDHQNLIFVGWSGDTALRELRPDEQTRMFGAVDSPRASSQHGSTVVVPWDSTHLMVELIEYARTGRMLAMAKYSGNEIGVLGYDSIPVTSSATVADGMSSVFARNLSVVRAASRVAMISHSAAAELQGVMAMGAGRGDVGPDIRGVPLAAEAGSASESDLANARAALVFEGRPLVLVVGSHEPRKNHLAVLHAAEVLWREGIRFSLVLIGAGSWNASDYEQRVTYLRGAGRPLQSLRALPDRLLWAAYRLAHVTLFPSLNEGFGLPVAESLSVGTPVITSRFGSMREIVAPAGDPQGGLLVDPRDDDSIIQALRTVLTDEATYRRLQIEAGRRASRTWDDYASQVWSYLVDASCS